MAQVEAATQVDFGPLRSQFLHSLAEGYTRKCTLKIAQATAEFIRKVVVQAKYDNIGELLSVLREHQSEAQSCCPSELVIRNIFLMAMKLARTENAVALYGDDKNLGNPYDSLNTLWKEEGYEQKATAAGKKVRKGLIQAVKELETSREAIVSHVSDIFQLNDTVLTFCLNTSPTMRSFIDAARKFRMRQVLSVSSDLEDTACPDYAASISLRDVAAHMPDCTKVLLPCSVVFPDGSCLAPAGSLSIAYAAHRHAVPVHVVAAFYKISPYFAQDAPEAVRAQGSAGLPVKLFEVLRMRVILSPKFDVIPAHLLSMYISNSGAVLPAHMYRLISDYYHPEDLTY